MVKINGLYYITLDAKSPFERGVQHGSELKYLIHTAIAQWRQWIHEFLSKQDPDREITGFVQDTGYVEAIGKYTPDLLEEVRGIAEGAEIDGNTLFAYQMFDELLMYVSQKHRLVHCTGFGIYGRKGLPNIMGQNNDLPRFFEGTHTLMHIKNPASEPDQLVFTWAGSLGNNGVNDKSIGVTINIVPTLGSGDTRGLPMPYIVRTLLSKNSREEAVGFLGSLEERFAVPMNYFIGDAEKVVTVETSTNGAQVFEGSEGARWVVHANHHLKGGGKGLEPGAFFSTVNRLETLEAILDRSAAWIDVEQAKKMMRTKPVLRDPISEPDFPTVESIVIELFPDRPRLHVTSGPPNSHVYNTFDFRSGFVGAEAPGAMREYTWLPRK